MMSNDSNENDHSHHSIFNSKSNLVSVEKFLSNDGRRNSSYLNLKNSVENVYENLQHIESEQSSTVKPLLNLFHEFLLNFKIKTKNSSAKTKDVRKEFKIELLANTLIKNNNTFNLNEFFESEEKLNECDDDHIYENLRFDSMKYDNITFPDDDSVVNWLQNLSKNVYIYEDEDPIFYVKRVPSKVHFFNCCSEFNFNYVKQKMSCFESEDELEFAKLVLSSEYCDNKHETLTADDRDLIDGWDSLTYCDSETDLLGGLLEIFDSYFCENTANKQSLPITHDLIENQATLLIQPINSQEHNFKFINYILSSISLNKIVISYDKYLKLHFNNYCFVERRKFLLNSVKFPNKQAKRNLRFLDINTMENLNSVDDKIESAINDKSVVNSVTENNYEKLWETVGCLEKNIQEDEHIYVALTPLCSVDIDENEWEIDSEFSFQKVNSGYNSDFGESIGLKTICVLYSDEDANNNQIVYNYDRSQSMFQYHSENNVPYNIKESISSRVEQIQQPNNNDNDISNESVVSWKKLLRHVYYCDDEEDVIMTEKVIPIVYQFTDLELEKCFELNKELSDTQSILSNESSASTLTTLSKTKDTINLFSSKHANFNVISVDSDDASRTISGSGIYKHLPDNDLRHSELSLNVTLDGEPKKERERFRDKMKAKFKIKSSKTSLNETEENGKQITKEDSFEKYLVFGCDLDRVEKDHPNYPYIPRIVKECIELLNQEENIKTLGIYRASGNKMCIESIKKKINEKKYSKKESKYSLLLNQDIHTITGILKMYFRELKPSLIPSEIFCKLCERDNMTTESIKSLLNAMPLNNLCTLKFLMNHLKLVEKNKNDNMMNATNLAIVWGVCIFSTSFDSLEEFYHNEISKSNMLFKKLLDNYDSIFTTDLETYYD